MYQAISDAPAVNFSNELIATYPGAKVILSKRDPEKWLDSIFRSYHAVVESPVFRIAAVLDAVSPESLRHVTSADMLISP